MAAQLSSSVFGFAEQKTSFDLKANYVTSNYQIIFGVSVLILVGLFLCSAIMGALRGDPHIVVRSVVGTATAVIGSAVALGLLQMMLNASDELAEKIGNGTPLGDALVLNLLELHSRCKPPLDCVGGDGAPFAFKMVMSLLVAIFSFALFIVLFVRKIAIIAIAVFIPLYLAGQGSVTSQNWMRRAGELLAALIFVKPAIYAIFTLGMALAMEANGSAADQTLQLLTAIAIMIASVFSPLVLFQIIGFVDVQLTRNIGVSGRRGAASFGHGAGAMLGATSRDTFRSIGSRLQTRGRGALAGSSSAGGGGSDVAGGVFTGRPKSRPAARGPGSPVRTPAPARVGAPRAGAAYAGVGAKNGSSGSSARGGTERGPAARTRARAASPRSTATPGSSTVTPRVRTSSTPRATHTALPPGRPGGSGR
jgi:hypothetical protein